MQPLTSFSLLSVLVACAESPKATPDLECAATAPLAPTSVAQGRVVDEIGGAPIDGAFVELLDRFGVVIASAGTAPDGSYQMASATAPVMRRAQAAGYLDAITYDPDGLHPMLDPASADRLARSAGIDRKAGTGMILAIVEDCGAHPIEGATVHVSGGSQPLYLGADTRFDPRLTATSTDSAALIFNVPPGAVTVDVVVDGIELAPFEILATADTLITTTRRP